jgi:autotransporter-associated beta strand protein
MKPKYTTIHHLGLIAVAFAGISVPSVHAASQTWTDSNSDALWNTTSPNWSGAVWTNNNDAVFGSDGVGAIAVDSGVIVNDIRFGTSGYLLTGSLQLSNDLASTFAVDADEEINAVIANNTGGASFLTKTGAGILTLSGANTYTGTTAVNAGTLSLTGSLASTALSTGGGTFSYDDPAATSTQAFTTTGIARGGSSIRNTVAGNTLSLGALSQTAGTGATVNLTNTGAITTSTADTNGMIGGWAVVSTGGTTLGWAHNDGSAISAATTAVLGTSFSGNQSATNWTNTDGNTTLTGATQVNSFISASDVAISGLLTINSGGMVLGSNASKWIQNGAAGQITTGLASGELFVYTPNPGATDMRIRVPLVNNGATPAILVKDGAGRLDLEAANTYTGATILNQGILYLRTNTALGGSSGIVVNGNSGITISTNVDYGGPITGSGIFNNGAVTGNASLSLFGDLSGFTGTLAHTTSNGHNNFNLGGGTTASMDASQAKMVLSGSTTQSRNVNINGTGDPVFKLGDLSGSGGKINLNNGTKLQVGALGLNSTFGGNISSTGGLEKIGGGTLTLTNANSYGGATTVIGGILQLGNGTTGALPAGSAVTVGVNGKLALALPAAATFSNGVVVDGVLNNASGNDLTLSGAIDGAGSIVKDDFGTLTLSGSGTFSGTATVTAGVLKVTGFNDTAAVALGAATLTGSGSVGAVTVNDSSAILSNGNGDNDDLQAASLTFSSAATLNLNKSADPGTASVQIAGNLSSTAGIIVNVVNAPAWVSGQTYNLISYGSLTGSAAHFIKGAIPGLGGRQSATIGSTGATNGFITLAIGGDSPYWTGAQNNSWTTAIIPVAKNWKLQTSGTATDFQTDDLVTFNDNLTANPTVNITGDDVQVVGVAFDNSANDYIIQSTGGFGIVDGSSAASLTKSGVSTVTLNTDNGYTGVTTINEGTLQLGDGTTDGDIATSSGIVNNGTLVLNRSAGSFTYGNPVSGTGQIVKNGAGTQVFTGTSSFIGSITNNAGVLQVGDGGFTGSLGTATITNDASLVFNRADTVLQGTDFGTISGTGSVTQSGPGTLRLSAANGYSGGTLVSSGTVAVANDNAFGTGAVTLNGGALTNSNSGNAFVGNEIVVGASGGTIGIGGDFDFTFGGTISGAGDLNLAASAPVRSINWNFSANTMTGGTITTSAAGATVFRFNVPAATSPSVNWVLDNNNANRGNMLGSGTSATYHFGSLGGSGLLHGNFQPNTVLLDLSVGATNNDATFSGVIKDNGPKVSVIKVGSGTWTLSGTNAYTGDTTVQAGVLAVGGTAIADGNKLVIDGGKVDPMGATEVVGTLYFGATQKAAGTWGATGSGATNIDDTHFTGTGVVSVTTGPVAGYSAWATANGATGQTMAQDHDNDGVDNGVEYFMGQTGSSFTPNPAAVGGTVTWPMGATYTGVYGTDYKVQTSGNLSTWDDVAAASVTITPGASVAYALPAGGGKLFVRLVVNN